MSDPYTTVELQDDEAARRVRALREACAGIPTEALEAGVVQRMRESLEAVSNRENRSDDVREARAILKELDGGSQ